MSTIERIEISHHRLPLDPPFKASWDGRDRIFFDTSIVRITDSDGRVGIGSGDLMLGFVGHEDLFIGQDPRHVERHYEVLAHIQFHYGRCWPVDLALWDLAGKVTGEPVWRMMGGRSNQVRLYASSGVLRDVSQLVDTAQRFQAEGFAAMKVRFNAVDDSPNAWRNDIKRLEAVRAATGDDFALMVDCNQGWRMPWDTRQSWTLKDAAKVAAELEKLGIYWMEEPLHRADHAGMAALRQMTTVRIAGGEMTRELYEFRDLIEKRALDVLQPDVALVGGLTGARRVALLAREANLTFTPHSWTNGIGVLANAHLTAGIGDAPWLEWPYDPPEWSLARRDFALAAPLKADKGIFKLDDAPGLGITLDEAVLSRTKI